jgi:hypothetical protein
MPSSVLKKYGCELDLPYMPEYNAKVKFTLEQATKAQRGSGGIALLFL